MKRVHFRVINTYPHEDCVDTSEIKKILVSQFSIRFLQKLKHKLITGYYSKTWRKYNENMKFGLIWGEIFTNNNILGTPASFQKSWNFLL